MMYEEQKAIQYSWVEKKINGIAGFRNINVYEMLMAVWQLIDKDINDYKKFRKRFSPKVRKYMSEGSGSNVLLLSQWGNRGDQIEYSRNVCRIIGNMSLVRVQDTVEYAKHISFYLNLIYVPIWYLIARKISFSRDEAWIFASELYKIKNESLYLRRIIGEPQIIVLHCDVHPVEYHIAQKMRGKYSCTVTLQHGFFSEDSLHFKNSHSDYFLANSNISATFAKKHNLNSVVTTGLWSDINEIANDRIKNNGLFGVLMGAFKNDEMLSEAKRMLEIVDSFAVDNNIKYILRYHPANEGSDIHKTCMAVKYISSKEETMSDFMEKVDFVIMGQSVTWLQTVNKLIPSFLFETQHYNMYGNVEGIEDESFATKEKLQGMYESFLNYTLDDVKKKKRKFLGTDDIQGEYVKFFEKLELEM